MKTFVRLRRFSGGDATVGMASTDVVDALRVEEVMIDTFDEVQVFEDGKHVDTYQWSVDKRAWVDLQNRPISLADPREVVAKHLKEGDRFSLGGFEYVVRSVYTPEYGSGMVRILFSKTTDSVWMSMDVPRNLSFIVEREK